MSYSVSGTTITLTRGDTFKAVVSITQQDGSPYVPTSGDKVRFAMKAKYEYSNRHDEVDVKPRRHEEFRLWKICV